MPRRVPESTKKGGQRLSRKELQKRKNHLAEVEAHLRSETVVVDPVLRAKLENMREGYFQLVHEAKVMREKGRTPAEIRARLLELADTHLKREQLPSAKQAETMIRSEKNIAYARSLIERGLSFEEAAAELTKKEREALRRLYR